MAVLAIELVGLTTWHRVPTLFTPLRSFSEELGWSAGLFRSARHMWPLALWVTGACWCLLTPRLGSIAAELRQSASGHRWTFWLPWHVVAFIGFALLTSLVFARPTDPARLAAPWWVGWMALATATVVLWLLAVAPGPFWLRQVRQGRAALLMGGLIGTFLWWLVGMFVRQEAPLGQKPLWGYLSDATLRLVSWLLSGVYSDVVYEPAENLVGTETFHVGISYACSGIEGISLITFFLIVYLWLFRNELRFPQALWLFPLGWLAVWLSNALRIAMLILIGSEIDPKIALGGFHAQAGWIAFVLIALGLIAAAHKTSHFAHEPATRSAPRPQRASLAEALLVPLLVLMAASAMTSAVSAGFDRLYWARALIAMLALWYYRKAYRDLGWSFSWEAVGIGVLVFAVWMLLEPATDHSATDLARGLAGLSSGAAAAWITFRVLGSVFIVPIVEELAFRGYLLRKFIAPNFEDIRLGQLTVFSLLGSSALFGLLHGRWLAGTVAGMLYALAVYRRGQIGDAVLAHATTNALIAAWVLTMGRWGLW